MAVQARVQRWSTTVSVPAECQISVGCVGSLCGSHSSSTKPTDGHKAILRLGGAGKDHGGKLIPKKVTMKDVPSTD